MTNLLKCLRRNGIKDTISGNVLIFLLMKTVIFNPITALIWTRISYFKEEHGSSIKTKSILLWINKSWKYRKVYWNWSSSKSLPIFWLENQSWACHCLLKYSAIKVCLMESLTLWVSFLNICTMQFKQAILFNRSKVLQQVSSLSLLAIPKLPNLSILF